MFCLLIKNIGGLLTAAADADFLASWQCVAYTPRVSHTHSQTQTRFQNTFCLYNILVFVFRILFVSFSFSCSATFFFSFFPFFFLFFLVILLLAIRTQSALYVTSTRVLSIYKPCAAFY